jgi:hypothetical protein
MKPPIRLVTFILFGVATCLLQWTSALAAQAQDIGAVPAQSTSVRILNPVAGQTMATDFVRVQYELARPALSDEPNFLVQLDTADPVSTSELSYTFTDVEPGLHVVCVTLVDANKVPVQGPGTMIRFTVTAPLQPLRIGPRGSIETPAEAIAALTPAAPIPPELDASGDMNIPLAGSPLPLLSLIGFGLLIGGAAQAMRAR